MERTDFERFSTPPAPLVVVLGGKEYALAIQRKGQTAQFRKKLRECLGDADGVIAAVKGVLAAADDTKNVPLSELPVGAIAEAALSFLGEGANELLDLVYEYDPALAEHRDEIEAAAFDHEVCAAVVEIVKVVFGPFLGVLLPGMKAATNPDDGKSTKAGA